MSVKKYDVSRPHPWHGIAVGPDVPNVVTAYIEITTTDEIKYEVCKTTGYLRLDRPFRASNLMPTIYGFIPRTYCGDRVGALAGGMEGDGDPLDICVLSERPITKSDILLDARIIGGIQMIDGGEADDKIIAVLPGDAVYGAAKDISDIPSVVIERIQQYFLCYKQVPGKENKVKVDVIYDRAQAVKVLEASMADYADLIAKG